MSVKSINDMPKFSIGNISREPLTKKLMEPTKAAKIAKYREMSYYPEIANALDMITDEAVVPDDNGKLVTLSLRKEVPEHIEEELRKIWDYLVTDVFSFNETSWEMFYRWPC